MYYVTARVNGIPPPGLAEAEPVSQCTAQSQAPPAAVSRCLRENPCTHFREDTHLLCPFRSVLPGDFIKAERTPCTVHNFIHNFTFVRSCNCCAPSSVGQLMNQHPYNCTLSKSGGFQSVGHSMKNTHPVVLFHSQGDSNLCATQ